MPRPNASTSPYSYTSYSRLEAYGKCSEFYHLKYVKREKTPEVFNESFAVGSMVHTVLEEVLDPNTSFELKDSELVFSIYLEQWTKKHNLNLNLEKTYELCVQLGTLLYKASSRYCGEDAIRNNDGSVPSNVIAYPPKTWSRELKESGVSLLRLELDNTAGHQNSVFLSHSFSFIFARAFSYITNLKLPSWCKKTLAVEMPVSTTEENRVKFPGEEELSINAYIDWVFETVNNEVIISDHKTSASKPLPESVLHNPQLNLYGILYYKLTGVMPTAISIHHVSSGELILADFDIEIATNTLKYMRDIQDRISESSFVRRHPNEFNTPCIKRDYRSGVITEVCPYLDKCWPTYHECVSSQIAA